MNDKQLEQFLQDELDRLERDIAPGRDLWPGIDHAINGTTVAVPKRAAIAAGLVLALSLALSAALTLDRPQQQAQGVATFIAALQSEHERNKQALLVEYRERAPLARDWELQMEQLEEAEQVIYQALGDDPVNLELLKILRQVQTKQIELIESVYARRFTTI